jgi:hypothetical protein
MREFEKAASQGTYGSNCEGHAPSTKTLDTTKILELRWQLPAATTIAERNVDKFCVSRLEAF